MSRFASNTSQAMRHGTVHSCPRLLYGCALGQAVTLIRQIYVRRTPGPSRVLGIPLVHSPCVISLVPVLVIVRRETEQ